MAPVSDSPAGSLTLLRMSSDGGEGSGPTKSTPAGELLRIRRLRIGSPASPTRTEQRL
jgi:hypothetical protein